MPRVFQILLQVTTIGAVILLLTSATAASSSSPPSSFHPRGLSPAAAARQSSNIVSSSLLLPSSSRPSGAWATRRHVTFMVPRGGGSVVSNDDKYDSDCSLEEDEDEIELSDDDDACVVAEEGEFEEEEEEGYDEEDEPLDPREPSHFSFLSFLPRQKTSLTSFMMQYASMLLRVTRRTCVAGARAIVCRDEHEEGGGPMVHTPLERMAHVFGEMYHAALTPEEKEEGGDGKSVGELDDEGKHTKKHKKRRRSGQHADSQHVENHRPKRRHRHRNHKQYTTAPTEVVHNGGGMEPSSPPSSTTTASINHAILQLAKQYDAELPVDEKLQLPKRYIDTIQLSSQTSLMEALQKANANARFLVVYLAKSSNRSNAKAVPNLLSPEVVKMAKRRPLGKKQTSDSGSYYLWITNDDKDYDIAVKRLKLKPPTSSNKSKSSNKHKKKSSAPILAIIYPAPTIDPSTGKLKVSPKVLAQHHCHPPPSSSETFIAWVKTIRKRHLKEYAKLQHAQKELALLKERTEGYVSSMKEDRAREEKEEREAQVKKEEEERERQRLAALAERRKQLLEELAEEPEVGSEGVITIALRFATGNKRDQRRFLAEETSVNDVFNWIDAVHGVERETIELSTMNGSKVFRYVDNDGEGENVTLAEAGLGKMTALRVSEIIEEAKSEEEEEESGEDEEDYDQEESEDEYE